ncbi:MAG: branched-chain amino acid ABC transporter substrate-binding protein, partial [Betaproteobacteria bacterium]|nr:branched-chain amino acid ABC transporter substrate-binding protein [Betaproteobacteria bacterium]
WAVERINARGGVQLPAAAGGARPLELVVMDSKGNPDEALAQLRQAEDEGIRYVAQGNSSAVALQLVDALDRHNARDPAHALLFLNYSAVEPSLTNEHCSRWHFRFDAHADMRMAALMQVLAADTAVKKAYLIAQDYSFGQQVLREARRQLAALRPDVQVVGDELHPVGRVKDFAPYAAKIVASGAQAVITGNWGNDLTLLIKAARSAGYEGKFYTFYANALGAPAAIGEAGVGKVLAVAEWHPNMGGAASDAFYEAFRARYPKPEQDYLHMRMQVMMEMLAQAIEKAGSTDARAVGRALEGASYRSPLHTLTMRAADHQAIQPLVVSVMERRGTPGVRFDNEGSGFGFKTVRVIDQASQMDTPEHCVMSPWP